jgi:hypothetical protein
MLWHSLLEPKMRYLVPFLLLAALLTGCGISQETKDLTNDVFGYNGINDQYMDVSKSVIENQIVIMTAIKDQHGEDFELTITRADGEQAKVKVVDWIGALNLLKELPGKLKQAGHAVNDAVQADKGLSAFTEQLMRTLKADKVLDWFLGDKDEG